MAIKKGNAPKSYPAKLEIVGGGETNILNVVFHHRKSSEMKAKVDELKGSPEAFLPMLVLFVVKEWDTDHSLSLEGVQEMEDERQGICDAILAGFHKTRRVELEGN